MLTPQIEKTVKKEIYNAINSLIDNYINGKAFGTRTANAVISKSDYDSFFSQKPKTVLDFKSEIRREKNFNNLLKDINQIGMNMFNSELEYKNYVKKVLNDIIEDRVAEYLDKKETSNMKKVMTFENFNESVYSNLSKSLGWNAKNVSIPSMEEIEELIELAENGDVGAFRSLFAINRFAEPKNDDEIERLNYAVDGFRKTENIYR